MAELSDFDFEKLREEKEWRKCAPRTNDPEKLLEGFIYFCENYWHIRHPERGRIKFEMFEAQVETIESWLTTRYSLILKARQIGFSTLVATYAFWLTFFYRDRPVLLLSRTEREAIKLLQKAKYGAQFLPDWMKYKGPPMNQTQTKMEFSNGSYVESLPSASDPARGESAYLIVVDELAFLPNSNEAWSAIEPVADVGGRVIMLSTANGEGNLFHQLWVGARAKANRFTPLFFSWAAAGRDQDWYEAKKRDLLEWQLAQEYPDNEEDAFLKSGRPVFDLVMLRQIEVEEPIAKGYLKKDTLDFVEDGGALHIYEWPDSEGKYVVGADPAQGLEHGDFASAHVINARDGKVVAHWHGHIDPDLFATEVLAPLGKFYGQALLGVESNNHGLTTLKFLKEVCHYFPIYYQRSPQYKRSVPTDILGYRTTQVTKPLMIDELNEGLRSGRIICLDEPTIAELRTYVRNDKGKMEGSPYDDRTISFAIAVQMLKFVFMAEFVPEKTPQPGTFGYMEKMLFGESFSELIESGGKKYQDRPRIGQNSVRRGSVPAIIRPPSRR